MKKKFQVFISSTYLDLKEERQACVETILEAGHIPAGMELFSAGDESQLETIKRWIEESDIYMLLLGGRYGSIEPISGLSYTEVEYRHAIEKGKPLFSIVISEPHLAKKADEIGQSVLELDNRAAYDKFKKSVLLKTSKFYENTGEIKLAIVLSLNLIVKKSPNLEGWTRSDETTQKKSKQSNASAIQLRQIENSNEMWIGDYTFKEIYKVLLSSSLEIDGAEVIQHLMNYREHLLNGFNPATVHSSIIHARRGSPRDTPASCRCR